MVKVEVYTTTWCPGCKTLHPIIEELIKTHPEIEVVQIDVEKERHLGVNKRVRSCPTSIIYKDDVEFKRILGAYSIDEFFKQL